MAPHAAYPELRRRKAEALASAPLARGHAQGEVWEAVADKLARHGAGAELLRVGMASPDGWPYILREYAEAASPTARAVLSA